MPEILIGQQRINYTVRKSEQASYVRLRITLRHGLQVIIPTGAKITNIEQFIHKRANWVIKHLERMDTIRAQMPERRYLPGETLLYLGEERPIELVGSPPAERTTVAYRSGAFRITARASASETERIAEIQRALEQWYTARARVYIPQRVAELAAQHGFRYARIAIRNQRTRWGSCSSKGNLNFNWRLMMTPPQAMDYTILHELCHLRELNHSPRFWALLATLCPDYKVWVEWFKVNGLRLYL